jgi:hypothetical protein
MTTMICPVDTTAGPSEILGDIDDIVREVFGGDVDGVSVTPQGHFGGAWMYVDYGFGGRLLAGIDPSPTTSDDDARYQHLLIDQLVDLMKAYEAVTDDHVARHHSGGFDVRV